MGDPIIRESAPRFHPIDTLARNGRAQIVRDAQSFAIARWDGTRWLHPCTGIPLDFHPTEVAL